MEGEISQLRERDINQERKESCAEPALVTFALDSPRLKSVVEVSGRKRSGTADRIPYLEIYARISGVLLADQIRGGGGRRGERSMEARAGKVGEMGDRERRRWNEGGRRETRRGERGVVVVSRAQFAARPAPAVRCRVEPSLRPRDPKSPSLPSHRPLSSPTFIYLVCIALVDSAIALETWADGRSPYNPSRSVFTPFTCVSRAFAVAI
jgi:hypothetical protein